MKHETSIVSDPAPAADNHCQPSATRYRWSCSCGAGGIWKPREFQARQGAAKHIAAKASR